jgi:acyl-CoA synthetase (AMP-forming)/AMP-acid ligase II
MLGYLDDPAATAEAIDADGWLHTGDVGTLDADGNLRITDRLKDMYISGGFNVYPAEVEQVLARLDGVTEVAVVGVPDERLGEVGRAYVVSTGSTDAVTPEAVLEFARERLANYKVPHEVELIDALPRNLSGKVLKKALRDGS